MGETEGIIGRHLLFVQHLKKKQSTFDVHKPTRLTVKPRRKLEGKAEMHVSLFSELASMECRIQKLNEIQTMTQKLKPVNIRILKDVKCILRGRKLMQSIL